MIRVLDMAMAEFGFYPVRYDVKFSRFEISTLENFDEAVECVLSDPGVYREWIYPPLREVMSLGASGTKTLPYVSRVFGLPKTHRLTHDSEDPKRLAFLVSVFGFFVGMKTSEQEAGFLDAAALKPGASNDVIWFGESLQTALSIADEFYETHSGQPAIQQALRAAIHSFLLSDLPQLLDFEEFIHLYTASEAAAKAFELQFGKLPGGHARKIEHLCLKLGVTVPWWANGNNKYVASRRNETIHDGLFFGEPWGFAVFGGAEDSGTTEQMTLLELRKLLSRIIMAILGVRDEAYLSSPVDDRQVHGIHLP